MKIKYSFNSFNSSFSYRSTYSYSDRYNSRYSSLLGQNSNRWIFAGKGLTRFISKTAYGLTGSRDFSKDNSSKKGRHVVDGSLEYVVVLSYQANKKQGKTRKTAKANPPLQIKQCPNQQRESVIKFALALLLFVVVISITTHSSVILTLPFFQNNPEELSGYLLMHTEGLQWGWIGYLMVTIIPGMLSYLPPELVHLVKIYLSVKNTNSNQENSKDAFPIIDWNDLWSDEKGSLNKMKLTLKFCDWGYSLDPEKK